MAEKHTPLDQFKIKQLSEFNLAGYDLSFTNSSLFMLLAVLSIGLFFGFGMRSRALVPGRMQSLAEMGYEFVAGIAKENIGKAGRKYFPFIFTLFIFILFCNLLGIIPYSFTATSHIIVTFSLAMLVFLTVLGVGFANHGIGFFKLFVPSGLPGWMIPIMIPIELVSFLARPISLSIRLAAAMTAGHILLKVFAGFIVMLASVGVAGQIAGILLPLPVLVILIGLEIFVAFLQAYIFALLTSIYLNEAIHLH